MRLGRAALFALGTGAATIASACGGNIEGGGDHHGVSSEPPYGAVPFDAGGDDGSNDGAADASSMGVALYGGFSPEDASSPPRDAGAPDATQEADSSSLPDTGVVPPYGQPPSPPPPPDEDAGD
jgi:hypothetical protein